MADNPGFYSGDIVQYIYGDQRLAHLRERTDFFPERVTSQNLEEMLPKLAETEVLFSCWGMLKLTPAQLEKMPNLKAVFYAGGSVSHFADPFLRRGVTVCNAVDANAIPVAEFCLAQILLAMKGYFQNTPLCRKGPWKQALMPVGPGSYGETVALLGIGAISRYLLDLLRPFRLRIVAVSNYLASKPEKAREMGIERLVSIEEAFREGYVVSCHLPDKESNKRVLKREHFASMRKGATFINTGRGGQVDEEGLISVLRERDDLIALLDVQDPEPPMAGSPLFTMPNIHMTSHIAGSTNDEVQRMADFMLEEFDRWEKGEPLKYAVDMAAQGARA